MKIVRCAVLACLIVGAAACNREGPLVVDPRDLCTPVGPSLGAVPEISTPLRASALTLPLRGRGTVSDRFTSELWVHGRYAYTGTWGLRAGNRGNTLHVWDVEGDTPVLVNSVVVEGAGTLGDVQTSDDGRYLVVATEPSPGSIVIYDLENPVQPRLLSRFPANTGVHTAEVARVDGRLYAFLSVNPSPPRLVIVDLSDPSRPRQVFSGTMGSPFIHDVFVRDGLLFTALWNQGTTVWDIGGAGCGSPADPVKLVNFSTVGGNVHNVWWLHDPVTGVKRYAFIGEESPGSIGGSSSGDIHVVDLGDWTNPREVAYFRVEGAGTHNFSVDEASGVLYAAFYNGGVRALDVRGDLGACTAEQRASDGRCDLGRMGREIGQGLLDTGAPVYIWGVQWVGNHLYASDMLNGLWKLDISALRR
jgi:hypothetical protein